LIHDVCEAFGVESELEPELLVVWPRVAALALGPQEPGDVLRPPQIQQVRVWRSSRSSLAPSLTGKEMMLAKTRAFSVADITRPPFKLAGSWRAGKGVLAYLEEIALQISSSLPFWKNVSQHSLWLVWRFGTTPSVLLGIQSG
jgi:hypothetical protein